MRVVLDTNVLARSAYSLTGPAAEVLDRIRGSDHVLIVSLHILGELNRVLRYPRLRRYHGLSDDEIERYVGDIEAAALVIPSAAEEPEAIVQDDPDDDLVIATAVAGQAHVLCTLDRHLWQQEVQDYCRQHGIQIMTDVELLEKLRRTESRNSEE